MATQCGTVREELALTEVVRSSIFCALFGRGALLVSMFELCAMMSMPWVLCPARCLIKSIQCGQRHQAKSCEQIERALCSTSRHVIFMACSLHLLDGERIKVRPSGRGVPAN